MVIRPLKRLYGNEGNIVSANKERKRLIKQVLGDKDRLDSIFIKLWEELKSNNLDTVKEILEEELFFEIVPTSFVSDVHKLRLDDDILQKLRVRYELFALMGASATWWRAIDAQKI